MGTPSYPEHDKLRAVKINSQVIGEFLEWLSLQGVQVCSYIEQYNEHWPITESTEKLLAMYFGIDLKVLEDEKLEMLEEQRKLNQKR